ncbi:MAG: transcription antitermination protein NusB [Rikenellaceae bacterium]
MISRRLIRIRVIQTLYTHFTGEENIATVSQRNLLYSLEKCHHLYYLMLTLPCEVAYCAQSKIDIAKDKHFASNEEKNPNLRLVENPVILQLSGSQTLAKFMTKQRLSWAGHSDVVKKIYNAMVEKEYYKEYMKLENVTYNDHKNFVMNFYKNEIEDADFLMEEMEDISIFWSDCVEYAASQALQTVSKFSSKMVIDQEKYSELNLMEAYKNSDDLYFAKELFMKSVEDSEKLLSFIDTFTHNWDVERIAFMDKLILLTAISEIKYFANIPINVTLNEFIEISKYYSSNKSGVFINGILDKVVLSLKESGEMPATKNI